MSILTDGDRKWLPLARRSARGFHLATEWYMNWKPLPYQWAWHQIPVMNTTWVAGIATGKTTAVAASYLIDCISTPYFRALNTSVTARQAELPFDMVMAWVEGNPKLEHLIENISLRPFPVIKFKNFSEYEFRTAGTDARFIRGSEYDRINYDEAGLDFIGETAKVLRGRLRGTRPDGTYRLARLDVTTSPTGALWLKERFKRGWKADPNAELKKYLSMRTATWDNIRLTKQQVEAMKAEYPPEMIDVEMGGYFPDFGFTLFPSGHIDLCVDQSLYDAAYIALNPEEDNSVIPGYKLQEDPRHGITHFEMPPIPGHIYILAGDPGTGNYPRRNASGVMVADVTHKPYKMVYFQWVSGNGSINPFLASFKYAMDKYRPVLSGIDATGPQSMVDEIAFTNMGIHTDKVNFNRDKDGMLNALSYDITNHEWRVPPIKGLITQAGTYTREEDKKIPQDLTVTWAMLALLARYIPEEPLVDVNQTRANFRNRKQRTTTSRRR